MRLRLKRYTRISNNSRKKFNLRLLRSKETQTDFKTSLSNWFQPLQELMEDKETSIETQWEHIMTLLLDTCDEVLGKKKNQHKEWISSNTIKRIKERKKKKATLNMSRTTADKAKAQEEYTTANKKVKRSIKKDKQDYVEELASQAEIAAGQRNFKHLYLTTRKLAGNIQTNDKSFKNKDGNPLTTSEEQLKRWAEHFRDLLNRPAPETPPAETEIPINCDIPSKAEIRKAITTLKNGKAAGPDSIPAEAIKADIETAVTILHSLFRNIWEEEELPAQ